MDSTAFANVSRLRRSATSAASPTSSRDTAVHLSGYFLGPHARSRWRTTKRACACAAARQPPYDRGADASSSLASGHVGDLGGRARVLRLSRRALAHRSRVRARRARCHRAALSLGSARQRSPRQPRPLGMDPTDDSDGFAELAPVGSFMLDARRTASWTWRAMCLNGCRIATPRNTPTKTSTDPRGPDAAVATNARVIRGGSYESPMAWLRGAARGPALPSERRPTLGFRCARSQAGTPP